MTMSMSSMVEDTVKLELLSSMAFMIYYSKQKNYSSRAIQKGNNPGKT